MRNLANASSYLGTSSRIELLEEYMLNMSMTRPNSIFGKSPLFGPSSSVFWDVFVCSEYSWEDVTGRKYVWSLIGFSKGGGVVRLRVWGVWGWSSRSGGVFPMGLLFLVLFSLFWAVKEV